MTYDKQYTLLSVSTQDIVNLLKQYDAEDFPILYSLAKETIDLCLQKLYKQVKNKDIYFTIDLAEGFSLDLFELFIKEYCQDLIKPKKISLDISLGNQHNLLAILDTIYNQYINKDYIENKHSNINLKDSEGYSIGTILVKTN